MVDVFNVILTSRDKWHRDGRGYADYNTVNLP
jgi:hypothetical protein